MPNIVYTVAERIEMVRQHEQGLSYRRIVDHFAAAYPERPIPSKATVQKMVKKFHETGNLDPSLVKITQPKKRLSEEKKLAICLTVEERVNKPLSKIAEELDVSKSTVHKIIKSHKHRTYKSKQRREDVLPSSTERRNDGKQRIDIVCKPEPIETETLPPEFVDTASIDVKDEYY